MCTNSRIVFVLFFFNDTATTEIYTLSLHDALPISYVRVLQWLGFLPPDDFMVPDKKPGNKEEALYYQRARLGLRSEEHTSELQSRQYLVCRLLLEKKKESLSGHTKCPYFLLHCNVQ